MEKELRTIPLGVRSLQNSYIHSGVNQAVFVGKYKSKADLLENSNKILTMLERLQEDNTLWMVSYDPNFIAGDDEAQAIVNLHNAKLKKNVSDADKCPGVLLVELEGYEESTQSLDKFKFFLNNFKEIVSPYHVCLSPPYKYTDYVQGSSRNPVEDIIKDENKTTLVEEAMRAKELLNVFNIFYKDRERIKILDLGGQYGEHYAALKYSQTLKEDQVSYTVFEIPEQVKRSNNFCKNINFTTEMPPKDSKFDIVYSRAMIQYFIEDDWKSEMQKIFDYDAKHIIIAEVYTTRGHNTHITSQRNRASVLCPYRVYNEDDIKNIFKENGYKVLHRHHAACPHYWQVKHNNVKDDRRISSWIMEKIS